MNPLNPHLERLFSLARSLPPPPTPRLEALVMSGWRARNAAPDPGSIYPAALACACGLLVLVLAASYGILAESENPTLLVAGAALYQTFHP